MLGFLVTTELNTHCHLAGMQKAVLCSISTAFSLEGKAGKAVNIQQGEKKLMKEPTVFPIAHQGHSTYFANVCLGLSYSPSLFSLYCICWFIRAEPVSKPEKLASQGPLLLIFIMANFRSSELQMEFPFFPLFSFTLVYFHSVKGVLTEVCSNRKTSSSLNSILYLGQTLWR